MRPELLEVIHRLRQEHLGAIDDADFPDVLAELSAAVPEADLPAVLAAAVGLHPDGTPMEPQAVRVPGVRRGHGGALGLADCMEILAVTGRQPTVDSLADVLEGALDEIEAIGTSQAFTGVPTGFEDLDALTNGLKVDRAVRSANVFVTIGL
ncbi:hypothetical protein BG452_02500 [Streptomyces sp. CBMA123]|nr:hypothetical protein [Streptomyces sp. CBMA123]